MTGSRHTVRPQLVNLDVRDGSAQARAKADLLLLNKLMMDKHEHRARSSEIIWTRLRKDGFDWLLDHGR